MVFLISMELIPIQTDGFHIAVPASLNDHPVRMLVDTGASRTVFDKETIKRICTLDEQDIEVNEGPLGGIGATNLESSITFLPSLRLGGFELKQYQAALVDLTMVNQMITAIGIAPVDGFIGGDLLHLTRATIDYDRMILKIKTPPKRKRGKTVTF